MVKATPQRKAAFYRATARSLEDIADNLSDARRRMKLLELADGFEEYADGIERASADTMILH
jgi:hypothetical protein